MQTNFDNDEAVGYLADRLAKLGVEDELRRKVLTPATKCASVVVPVWSNSIGIRPSPLVPKCSTAPTSVPEARICVSKSWTRARTAAPTPNVVPQYHEMMDSRAAVRDAMMAERKAGHWADPTVDDDRHDETSLFGHGESSEDGETEE